MGRCPGEVPKLVADLPDVEAKPLWITQHQFKRLLDVALHSPAVCLLRAVVRACPEGDLRQWYGHALKGGLTGVRHYFNRPYARAIIERVTDAGRKGYTEKVLEYCALGQLQAVLDEDHLLLGRPGVADATDTSKPGESGKSQSCRATSTKCVKEVVDSVTRVLTIGLGAPRVRVRDTWGTSVAEQGRSHFALAFSEESSEGAGGKGRRRHTREAFNSPFWPFVLGPTSVGQEGLDFTGSAVTWSTGTSRPTPWTSSNGRGASTGAIASWFGGVSQTT